jgi:hypothetical protein
MVPITQEEISGMSIAELDAKITELEDAKEAIREQCNAYVTARKVLIAQENAVSKLVRSTGLDPNSEEMKQIIQIISAAPIESRASNSTKAEEISESQKTGNAGDSNPGENGVPGG